MRQADDHHALSEPKVTKATAKLLLLDDSDAKDPKFPFVIERESTFWVKTPAGKIESRTKLRGKGFPGGGVEDDEEPYEAVIREGVEELGADEANLRARITQEITWTRLSPWDNHPWILYYGDGKGVKLDRSRIADPKLIDLYVETPNKKMAFRKFAWAHMAGQDLHKTILPPRDPEERQRRIDGGDTWFYTSHIVGLLAMLLILNKEELFRTVLRQVANRYIFTRPMLELLRQFGREIVYRSRLSAERFRLMPERACRIATTFLGLDFVEELELLRARADAAGWLDQLDRHIEEKKRQRSIVPSLFDRASEKAGQREGMEQMSEVDEEEIDDDSDESPFLRHLRSRFASPSGRSS